MIRLKNKASFEQRMESQLYDLLADKAKVIHTKSQQVFKSMYAGEFGKDPVNSGATKEASDVTFSLRKRPYPQASLVFEITPDLSRAKSWSKGSVADYAIFFIAPLQARNPNYKYGARPVVTRARDIIKGKLGIK